MAGLQPGTRLFVGSAIKTFILARIRDVEESQVTADKPMTINDWVRSLSIPVFLELTGTAPAVSVHPQRQHRDRRGDGRRRCRSRARV